MSTSEHRKAKLSQLERVREIHRRIKRYTEHPANETFRVTTESLAAELNVTDRQIRRDLDVLRERIDERDISGQLSGGGQALEFDWKRHSFRYLRPVDISVWVGRLDDEQLGALLVAQQALAVYRGMPLAKHVTDIFEDDAGGLVGNARSVLRDEITNLISFYPEGAGIIDEDHFTTIFRALLLSQQLEVRYQSKAHAAPVTRVLCPYHLCCFKNHWRLVAHDSKHDDIRVFVVTPKRLRSVKMLDRTFKRPLDFNALEHLNRYHNRKPQRVTIRVERFGAHHVLERNWTGLVSIKKLPRGAIEAVFEIADMGEFKRFVLAFGSDCEVVEPENFRKIIHEEAQGVLDQAKPPKKVV